MKILIAFIINLLLFGPAFSQGPQEDYASAKREFENGNIDQCLGFLAQCQAALGGSNPKIEALKCQALVMQDDWIGAGIAYNNYDRLLPADRRNGIAYQAMLDLHKQIIAGLAEVDKKEREKQEKEIQDDLALVERGAEIEQAEAIAAEKKLDDENEERLFKLAMATKDEELLAIYKTEIDSIGERGKIISTEIDKKGNPNKYVFPAAEAGDTSEVRYLIGLGADKNSRNAKGESLLHVAVIERDLTMLGHLLILGVNIEGKNASGSTALHWSIKHDFYQGSVKLLEGKADPKAIDGGGRSAIQNALLAGSPPSAKLLVKFGADVNAEIFQGGIGITPLYYAVFHSKDRVMVAALLSVGADINAYSNTNWTPLMAAVYQDNGELVQLLLTNGADMNKKGPHQWTAMHFAVRQHNLKMINLLVKGFDKNSKDEWNRSPMRIAKERRYKDVIKALKAG